MLLYLNIFSVYISIYLFHVNAFFLAGFGRIMLNVHVCYRNIEMRLNNVEVLQSILDITRV